MEKVEPLRMGFGCGSKDFLFRSCLHRRDRNPAVGVFFVRTPSDIKSRDCGCVEEKQLRYIDPSAVSLGMGLTRTG